jgi:hypothetical protein
MALAALLARRLSRLGGSDFRRWRFDHSGYNIG